MKKIKVLCLLCILIFAVSGCTMKSEYTVKIHKNKSMDICSLIAFDEELIEGMLALESESREHSEEEKWTFIEKIIEKEQNSSLKQERYQDGNFKGLKVVSSISNIDAISGEKANATLKELSNVKDLVLFEKKGNQYKLILKKEFDETLEEAFELNYQPFMKMNFVVTLPNTPISHNANEVSSDGKTLTWNLLDSTSQNIEVEFTLNDSNNVPLLAGIAGVLIIFIIGGMIFLLGKRRKKQQETKENRVIESENTQSKPQEKELESFVEENSLDEKEVKEDLEVETIDFSFDD